MSFRTYAKHVIIVMLTILVLNIVMLSVLVQLPIFTLA
jgi:hypothetical protein